MSRAFFTRELGVFDTSRPHMRAAQRCSARQHHGQTCACNQILSNQHNNVHTRRHQVIAMLTWMRDQAARRGAGSGRVPGERMMVWSGRCGK